MDDVDRWFESGMDTGKGLELVASLSPSPWLARLVTAAPRFSWLISERLEPFRTMVKEVTPDPLMSSGAFRRKWPFLEEPDCPDELKILAADMITSWHAFSSAHEELYSCATTEECFETAKKVLKNFTQNRRIRSEFAYYKEHHKVLGKHPIFAGRERLAELRRAPLPELVKRKSSVEKNIWRLEGRIKAGDRPDLEADREERLAVWRRELEDINRTISDYGYKGKE